MEHFDIAIIGTGSGNSILDERYADKRVAICEQGTFGGTCLNVGCIPTKMFVYAAEVAQTIRDAGAVRCRRARSTASAGATSCRACSAASTRSRWAARTIAVPRPTSRCTTRHTRFGRADVRRPLHVAHRRRRRVHRRSGGDRRGLARAVPDAITRLRRRLLHQRHHHADRRPADHLVIVGGGFVAAEFAHIFSALGSTRVAGHPRRHAAHALRRHVCERFTDIAAKKWEIHSHCNVDRCAARTAPVSRWMDDGVDVAGRRAAGGDRPHPQRRPARRRVGRRRGRATASVVVDEYQRTTARGIFALGDVSARTTSSSTSPTTRRGWSSTTCCSTGTTPTR